MLKFANSKYLFWRTLEGGGGVTSNRLLSTFILNCSHKALSFFVSIAQRGPLLNIFYLIKLYFLIGCIDGYSRFIVYLQCATNNRKETVLSLFDTALQDLNGFGPSRVRTDKGEFRH